jgi:hypothetical protein
MRVYIQPSGRIVRKIYKRSIARERRKLKKLRTKLDGGIMTPDDVWNAWQSWKSYALRFDAWHTVQTMGKLFDNLFSRKEIDYAYLYQAA